MYSKFFNCILHFVLLTLTVTNCKEFRSEETTTDGTTGLVKEPDNRLLLFSTIDGSLIAVEQQTGNIKWKTKDQPTVKVPIDIKEAIVPLFLPDPKDGSLYLLGGNNNQVLKKLPFTIPQLVASSPCRSTDGILYTGKKKDTWFMMDPETGIRQKVLGFEKTAPTCPITSPNAVYVGRTQYTIMMIDSKAKDRHWNVTFYDYTASPMDKEMMNEYALVHFAASSTGRIVTLDRRVGRLLWEKDLGSPIVAVYILDPDGFINAPFSSLAQDTLTHLKTHFLTHEQPFNAQSPHMQLYPTLYIGEHIHGLYALPSLVDQNVVTISATNSGPLLLEGPGAAYDPSNHHRVIPLPGMNVRIDPATDPQMFQSLRDKFNQLIILGYYNVPDYSLTRLQISGKVAELLPANIVQEFNYTPVEAEREEMAAKEKGNWKQSKMPRNPLHLITVGVQTDSNSETSDNSTSVVKKIYLEVDKWFEQYKKYLYFISIALLLSMLSYRMIPDLRQFINVFINGTPSRTSSSSSRYGPPITAIAEDLPDGMVQVGKIQFAPDQLLGKGCDGTFVYKGKFDNRDVAIKRLLPACFTFADREVNLLRESDEHPHVIRYFCMEQDRQFRYIALELCAATVQDYVQGRYDKSLITPLDILQQATDGLSHLHSLDIVHRDIKPPNVLLSMPNPRGEVRAMISDFGLCKKLQVDRLSFSHRSGITGTDGWIAPEMLNGDGRMTTAVDMFSLGCLFYYVLSDGKHPFGEPLRRQANILSGDYLLSELKGEDVQIELARMLIAKMINVDAHQRPPAPAVLYYPLFWTNAIILGFYQDVSDRIEKADFDDDVLQALERDGIVIVRGDWRRHIDPEVAQDLRKYRSYRGDSVRDLMRALRNKKHHYRELSIEAQHSLGDIPDKFTTYWNSRFPLLLLHSWLAMQCVKHEATFRQYYHTSFRFPEQSFKDTCHHHYSSYLGDAEPSEHIDQNDKFNVVDNSEFWAKKPKPKPKYERNTSPKKYNRRFVMSSNDTHLRNHIAANDGDGDAQNVPKERINTTFKQHRHQDTKPNFNHKKKNNHRQVEEPILWSLPTSENKKLQ